MNIESLSSISSFIKKNPELVDTPLKRTVLRKKIEAVHGREEALKLIPLAYPKNPSRSIPTLLLEAIREGYTPSEIIQYAESLTKSAGSFLVNISYLRKALADLGETKFADDLLKDDRYRELNRIANDKMEERVIEKSEISFQIPQEFDLINIISRLYDHLEDDLPANISHVADMMAILSARPSELFNLQIEDGYIFGHSKQRNKDNRYKYVGLVPAEDIQIMLDRLKQYPNMNPTQNSRAYSQLRTYLSQYGLTPRNLRLIGSIHVGRTEQNRIKRLLKQKIHLRHRGSGMTAYFHYSENL